MSPILGDGGGSRRRAARRHGRPAGFIEDSDPDEIKISPLPGGEPSRLGGRLTAEPSLASTADEGSSPRRPQRLARGRLVREDSSDPDEIKVSPGPAGSPLRWGGDLGRSFVPPAGATSSLRAEAGLGGGYDEYAEEDNGGPSGAALGDEYGDDAGFGRQGAGGGSAAAMAECRQM